MEQIRIACLVGAANLLAGAVLLAVPFLAGPAAGGVGETLLNVLSLAGLLLVAGGALMFVCTGAVLLVNFAVEPRARRQQRQT